MQHYAMGLVNEEGPGVAHVDKGGDRDRSAVTGDSTSATKTSKRMSTLIKAWLLIIFEID